MLYSFEYYIQFYDEHEFALFSWFMGETVPLIIFYIFTKNMSST